MKLRTLLPALVFLLLGACGRESSDRLELLVEPLGPAAGTKLAVQNDVQAVWTTGDCINVNGAWAEVTTTGAGQATVSGIVQREVNRACFPAGMAGSNDLSSDEVTMFLPGEYHYRTSGGAQLLDMPMAARAAVDQPLRFQHLTAALCVVIKNPVGGVSLTIDRITVGSNSYQLSGSRTVNMNAIASTAAVATDNAADRQVAMLFDREALVVPAGEQRKVLIPVLPVGSDNHFTISVSARHEGSRYNYSRRQTTGGALQRNVLAYAAVGFDSVAASPLFATTDDKLTLRTSSDLVILSEAAAAGWTLPGSSTKYSECNYRLANDIDMMDIAFHPIANYTGTLFDGDGYAISDLTIDGADGYCGLFKTSFGLTIQNLTLSNVTLRHTAPTVVNQTFHLGAFVGQAGGGVTMINCQLLNMYVEGAHFTSLSNTVYLGGLVGSLNGGGSLTRCRVTIESVNFQFNTQNCFFGNLLANTSGESQMPLVLNTCEVNNDNLTVTSTGNMNVGGLIGRIAQTKIEEMPGCSWGTSMSVVSTSEGTPTVNVDPLVGLKHSSASCKTFGATASGSISVTKNGTTTTTTVDIRP